jgi:adenylate kinase
MDESHGHAMRHKTVLLFGAPGSGKGTQGKSLGALPRYYHFACGDVFRSLDRNSPLGKSFTQFSQGGGLVPDELTVELWRQTIQARIDAGQYNPQNQILVLDGIPRTVNQARIMEASIDVAAIIYLLCNNVEEIVSRLRRRAMQDSRPDDTNEEVIRYRLEVYEEVTRPVLALYPAGRIFRVNAVRPPEQVTADLLKALERV